MEKVAALVHHELEIRVPFFVLEVVHVDLIGSLAASEAAKDIHRAKFLRDNG